MKKIVNFIKYNNLFTLVIMALVLGSGVTFAASPALRNELISSVDVARSIDNSYIISVDLTKHPLNLKVTNIVEDTDNYYVDYTFATIAIDDYAWRDITIKKTLTVAKSALAGKDLGVFVSEQLGQIIDGQLVYLKEAQKIEISKGRTQKIVSTKYAGLIGGVLGSKDKIFEGYTPVVAAVELEDKSNVATSSVQQPESERSKSVPGAQKPEEAVNTNDIIRQMVEQILANHNSTQATSTDSTSIPDPTTDETAEDTTIPATTTPTQDSESVPDPVTPTPDPVTPTPDSEDTSAPADDTQPENTESNSEAETTPPQENSGTEAP